METESEVHPRPAISRLIICFIFAWVFSEVCALSCTMTFVWFSNVQPDQGFTFGVAIIGLVLAVLRYATGAFVLGTLTHQRVKTWIAASIYVILSFLLHGLTFVGAVFSEPIKDELLANPGAMIVMPVVHLLIGPFVTFYFLRMGENSASVFSRPYSALNIPWYHWLWVLPFFLFQVIGVPFFLLLTLWKVESLTADISDFSVIAFMLSLPSFIPWIIVFAILAGIIAVINTAYSSLSERSGSTGMRIMKVLGAWVLLTSMQAFIFLSFVTKNMD